jgi:hypothetical protein
MRGVRMLMVVTAGVLMAACSHQSTAVTQSGTLDVHVSASGTSLDSVFTVMIDGSNTYSVTTGQDASFQVDDLSHTLTLGSVAPNCQVTSDNPQIAQVALGSTDTLDFAVSCTTNGQVTVTVATTGDNQDDQYTLTFNTDYYTVPVGPRQTFTVSLPVDTYSLDLTDVASNCAVQTPNPVSVTLVADSTSTVGFQIACSAP